MIILISHYLLLLFLFSISLFYLFLSCFVSSSFSLLSLAISLTTACPYSLVFISLQKPENRTQVGRNMVQTLFDGALHTYSVLKKDGIIAQAGIRSEEAKPLSLSIFGVGAPESSNGSRSATAPDVRGGQQSVTNSSWF
tara:strand:- start:82 stop:498 length:417 start_codon:yes stop_codon:yes gene_type:complete